MSDSITPKISENDPFMRLFEQKKTIKSPGDNIHYLKIYLYRNGALLKEFEPSMINPKYNKTIIFPSDFKLDATEINKILFNKTVIKKDNDKQDHDILYGNLDVNKINKLRISANDNIKVNEDVSKNIIENIKNLQEAFIKDKIINLEGNDFQMTSGSKITSKYNKILYQKLKFDKEINSSRYVYDYSRSNFNNMNYFFDNSNGDDKEITFHFNRSPGPLKQTPLSLKDTDETMTALLQAGGLTFHVAVDVVLTKKIKRKSDLRRIISPFDSCKTKRQAILELLDYKLNIFETDVLKLNDNSRDKIKKKDEPLKLYSKALSGNKPKAKPDAKPGAKPNAKSDAKPDAKPNAKSDAKPDAKPNAKPDAKPEAKPDAKPEAKPNAKPNGGKKFRRTKGKRRRTTKGQRRRTTKGKRRTRGLKSKPRKYIKTKKIKRRYI